MKLNFMVTNLHAEEAKTPYRKIYSNNNLIKSSHFLKPLPNILPSKPANSTISNADQPLT